MMITAALFAFCVVVIQGVPNVERSLVEEVEERHSARDCNKADAVECRQWKSFGWCNVEVYNRHCARECGFCKKEMANEVEVAAEVEVAVEERHSARDCNAADAPECPKWKEYGWCNVEQYAQHCARECGFCKQELEILELEKRD